MSPQQHPGYPMSYDDADGGSSNGNGHGDPALRTGRGWSDGGGASTATLEASQRVDSAAREVVDALAEVLSDAVRRGLEQLPAVISQFAQSGSQRIRNAGEGVRRAAVSHPARTLLIAAGAVGAVAWLARRQRD